jgi:hypothetical protein
MSKFFVHLMHVLTAHQCYDSISKEDREEVDLQVKGNLNDLDQLITGKRLSKQIEQQVKECRQRMQQAFPEAFAAMIKYPNFYNHPTQPEVDDVNELFCKIQRSLS